MQWGSHLPNTNLWTLLCWIDGTKPIILRPKGIHLWIWQPCASYYKQHFFLISATETELYVSDVANIPDHWWPSQMHCDFSPGNCLLPACCALGTLKKSFWLQPQVMGSRPSKGNKATLREKSYSSWVPRQQKQCVIWLFFSSMVRLVKVNFLQFLNNYTPCLNTRFIQFPQATSRWLSRIPVYFKSDIFFFLQPNRGKFSIYSSCLGLYITRKSLRKGNEEWEGVYN